jgi:hypothetical protein
MSSARLSIFASSLTIFCAACSLTGEDTGTAEGNDTVVINPADQTGWIHTSAPRGTLPACQNVTAKFGPSGQLGFDNKSVTFWSNQAQAGTAKIDQPGALVKGTYDVVINDTFTTVDVTPGHTTEVGLSWLEVEDVGGSYQVNAVKDYSNGTTLFDAQFSTGCGFYVLPGKYTVNVTYQNHTLPFVVDVAANKVATVKPGDLRGEIVVLPPSSVSHPDWAPASNPTFGPSGALSYDNGHFAIYDGTTQIGISALGAKIAVPMGDYIVALNDTKMTVHVDPAKTVTVHAGRLEVGAPASGTGTFQISAKNGDFSGGTTVFDAEIPMGTGLDLLPGDYDLTMKYQGQTIAQTITLRDQ